jgi:sugar lactone lactonase YvrE
MLTDREIVAAMQEANPLSEPELLAMDPAGFDVLLEKISERRVRMLHAPETRTEELVALPIPTTWKRNPVAVIASFVVIVLAVGAGALLLRGGDSDVAIEPGSFVTYGPAQGVPEACAFSMAFAGSEAYMVGECGLLHFDGGVWRHLTEWPGGIGALDLAPAPDGTVWISNIDDDVVQWSGDELVGYDLRASGIEVTPDGAVWAVQYVRWEDGESDEVMALRRLEGSEWVLENEAVGEEPDGLALGPDGTLWAVESTSPGTARKSLIALDGDDWITHETPDGLTDISGFATDGAIIISIGEGAFAVSSGDSWTVYDLPTLEELQIPPAIEDGGELIDELHLRMSTMINGTLWGHSGTGYGVFSFDGQEWTRYTTEDGLSSNKITFVEIGPDGSLWFGTEDAGVTRHLPER